MVSGTIPQDCNECEHISLTEEEQHERAPGSPHICTKYRKRVFHQSLDGAGGARGGEYLVQGAKLTRGNITHKIAAPGQSRHIILARSDIGPNRILTDPEGESGRRRRVHGRHILGGVVPDLEAVSLGESPEGGVGRAIVTLYYSKIKRITVLFCRKYGNVN